MLLLPLVLSIFFTPVESRAALEPALVSAASEVAACRKDQAPAACYELAANAVREYIASRPDRTHPYDGADRTFAGPRSWLTGHATEKVYVLIHGYSMSPAEMDIVGSELQPRGQNMISVLLEGHGSRSILAGGAVSLKNVHHDEWRQDVQFAVQVAHGLGQKVVLVGYSLGGLLAVLEGSQDNPDIAGVLAIAPPIALNSRLVAGSLACDANPLKAALEPMLADQVGSGRYAQAYWDEFAAGACELLALSREFNTLGLNEKLLQNAGPLEHFLPKDKRPSEIAKRDFSRLKVPYVIIVSPNDGVVDADIFPRLVADSAGHGVLLQSNAANHAKYGLGRDGSSDHDVFWHAFDLIDQAVGN